MRAIEAMGSVSFKRLPGKSIHAAASESGTAAPVCANFSTSLECEILASLGNISFPFPMRFSILGSGSSGNSALLVTAQARVLVDAGFSARRLDQLLAAEGYSLEQIDAVFLTHEHGDHASGIDGLKKYPQIQFYANSATAKAIQRSLTHRPSWKIFETGARFRFRDLEVQSFAVPHDAHEPVGFRFATGEDGDLFSPICGARGRPNSGSRDDMGTSPTTRSMTCWPPWRAPAGKGST
jgi:hypothetical protein